MKYYGMFVAIALLAIAMVPALFEDTSADQIYPEIIFHVSEDKSISVYVSEDMYVPEAEQRDGYTFKGWGLEDGTPLRIPGFMPDTDTDVYPIYEPIPGWEPSDDEIPMTSWLVVILCILTAMMAIYVLWSYRH